jgi:hypothetical protein
MILLEYRADVTDLSMTDALLKTNSQLPRE